MIPRITEADLLAAVIKATTPPPDDPGVTVVEYLAANPTLSQAQATGRLRSAVRAGKLLMGWAHRAEGRDGCVRKVRVFRPA